MATVPLTMADMPQVLQCLKAALQPGEVQKQAEAAVASMETRPGFCSCLAEIMLDKTADHSARWLASTQLKNMVAKYWRTRPDLTGARSTISTEEKAHLRSRLPQLIVQEDNQIAVQVALTWAKIVRQDYPAQWPTLVTDLLSLLSAPGASQLAIRRALLVVHHTTKELATKRLAADQKNFAQVAAQLFPPVWSQWCNDTAALLAGLPAVLAELAPPPPAAQQLLLTLERWLLLLKVLGRLLVFGHVSDHKNPRPVQEVSLCAPAMIQALQQLVALRPKAANRAGGGESTGARTTPGSSPQRNQLLAMMDRGLLKLSKVLVAVQDSHPWTFHGSGALLAMLAFCCDQLVGSQGQAGGVAAASTAWERYLIQCMAFIMAVQDCGAYKGKTASGEKLSDSEQDAPARALVHEVTSALSQWWTADRLSGLTHALVTSYGRLTAKDLEEWTLSSEEFYHSGDISGWQEHLGLAAEALFLLLLTAHRELLGPLVVQLMRDADAACPMATLVAQPSALPGGTVTVGHGSSALQVPVALLAYDAVMAAVAKGAYELHDYLDYSAWLRAHLLPVLCTQGPVLRVLRRQALRVVSCWVARLEATDRPAVYQAVLACLAEDDLCVQLTAVSCLHSLVDDWNFSEEQFQPFVGPAMERLLRVLSQANQLESQTLAFTLMNLIIERMGDLIRPYVEPLSALLPGLWQAAEGQSLLRIQVILALQRLVNVLGMASPSLYPLLLPLLQYCTDPRQPEALYLLEDGLGLWLVALRNAPSLQPALLAMLPHVAATMQGSTEHIAACMAVLTSAAIMARDSLTQYANDVCSVFTTLLGNVNERGMLLLLPAMEMVVGASPACVPALRPATSKLLQLILSGQESAVVQATGCCVLARLLLVVAGELPQLLTGDANSQLTQLNRLVEIWTEQTFDALAQPRQRKLSALGLCALIAHLPSQPVVQHLELILGCVTGVWAELEGGGAEGAAGGQENDPAQWAMWAAVDSGCDAELSCAVASEDAEGESVRRAELRASDPVPNASLRDALRAALEQARAALGQTLDTALATLDPTLSAQLQKMMTSTAAAPSM